MTQYCLENNFEAASKLQLQYLDLINKLFIEVNPIPVKEALNQMGLPSGPCRMPLYEMSDEHKAALRDALAANGLVK
jgi:4-hydroxy-tetrahydrodipicolinate synthase